MLQLCETQNSFLRSSTLLNWVRSLWHFFVSKSQVSFKWNKTWAIEGVKEKAADFMKELSRNDLQQCTHGGKLSGADTEEKSKSNCEYFQVFFSFTFSCHTPLYDINPFVNIRKFSIQLLMVHFHGSSRNSSNEHSLMQFNYTVNWISLDHRTFNKF